MIRSIRPWSIALAFAAAAACRPETSRAPAAGTVRQSSGDGGTAQPSEVPVPDVNTDLGPADDPIDPLGKVTQQEVEVPSSGPDFIYGRSLRGRRPNAPGRRGSLLMAIDTPYQIFGRADSYVHVAAWTRDGRPAKNARVYVGRTPMGRTDASGTLLFRYRQPKPATDEDKDTGWSRSSLFVIGRGDRCGAVDFSPYERTPTFATDHLFVYTDRGVFSPGDTVHTRLIGWRLAEDYAPLEAADVELHLRDEDRHTIAGTRLHTDDFGVASADLAVPLTAESGNYTLHVAYGEERATARIQVRHFAPPTMRVDHDLPRFLPRAAKALDLQVSAHPNGGPADWAAVDLEVVNREGKRLAGVNARGPGRSPVALRLSQQQVRDVIAGVPEGQLASFRIQVRDADGRSQSIVREIRVSANPYTATLELDRDAYSTGDPVIVMARVSDRDDVPARKQAFRLEVGPEKKIHTATTDDAGMARFDLVMPSRSVVLSLRADGVDTTLDETQLQWRATPPMRSRVDSPILKEGDTTEVVVRFPTGYRPAEKFVHLDITDTSGSIVGGELLAVRREGGAPVARGSVTIPSWGSLLLTFFSLGRDATAPKREQLGMLVSTQSLAVRPDRELEIELKGVPKQARPGAKFDLRAVVRDRGGAPAEVEVGAALVNRAILAMKDPLEITPMDKFYNPELRAMASTGAMMMTWPVVSRNWGKRHWDVALPPFPWLAGGAPTECRQFWDEEDWKAVGEVIGVGGLGLVGTGSGGGGSSYGSVGIRSTITIRTRFPATALWAPHLRGKGNVEIAGRFPDTIGEQELIVVASDKRGGVGVARKVIDVKQPVYTQTDLPDVAVLGERIELPVMLHNGSGNAAKFEVSISSHRTRAARSLTVGQGASAGIGLPWRPRSLGTDSLSIRAVGAGHDDRVVRKVPIVPPGARFSQKTTGHAKAGAALELDLHVPRDSTGNEAHLEISFPAVTSAMVGLPELASEVGDDPWRLASDLASAVMLLEIVDKHGLNTAKTEQLRAQVMAATSMLRRVQRKDGSFAYWRNGKSSPYVTARVLEGLLEAKRAGFPAADKTIKKAAHALAGPMRRGELASIDAIGWWEGRGARVQLGITAEIFDVLSQVPVALRSARVRGALWKLAVRFERYLTEGDVDPLTAGRSTTALLRLGRLSKRDALRVADRLIAQRDEDHWEPTWFHAYGGRIEATAAVLEALRIADPSGHQIEKRDALRWILATRSTWGTWHNTTGTVTAIRAIRAAGAAPEEIRSTVEVRLDGRVVRRIEVDPADPIASTLALRHLDLGRQLSVGRHRVEVRYDGKLAPAATVTTAAWFTGRDQKARKGDLRLRASGPSKMTVGDAGRLRIRASGKRLAGSTVIISPTALLDVDMGALARHVGRGAQVAELRQTQRGTELLVAPGTIELAVDVPMRAVRRGGGRLPTVGLEARSGLRALVSAPGSVEVE